MATTHELAAATLLDVITCLKEGQRIQEEAQRTNVQIQQTLVAILEGQSRIEAQLEAVTRRTNGHEHKFRVLESANVDHEARIAALEARPHRPSRAG